MSDRRPVLSQLEARILGVLVEKRLAVPDTYPLSLNALTAGCNQKTARDPVMSVTESEVQEALDELRRQSLVVESSGGRVMRYAENLKRALDIPMESVALLAMLMLRGQQTAAELRMNAERLQKFSDLSSVEGFLHELAERRSLVVELPRRPGERENRWAHLLCGPVAVDSPPLALRGEEAQAGDLAALHANISRLEAEVAGLRETVARIARELGLDA